MDFGTFNCDPDMSILYKIIFKFSKYEQNCWEHEIPYRMDNLNMNMGSGKNIIQESVQF